MTLKSTLVIFLVAILLVPATGSTPKPRPIKGFKSGYDELNPVITPDGKKMFLTIANHPQNLGGKKDPGDIWYCLLGDDNHWSEPVHGGALINDRGFNGVAGFSTNGDEMFLLTHYDTNGGTARTQGISVSRYADRGWSRPENINIPYFQNKSNIISGYVSPDKSFFVYSAETYGSYGVEDIFVCVRKDNGKWSEPKNLGSTINTQFQEIAPSLSADGKTIFYSTNGRKGKKSFDVYYATRLDESWTNWTEPVNLSDINSDGKDLYYRDFPALGFSIYTSTKDSDGYGEIEFFTPQTPPQPELPPVVPAVVVEEQKYTPGVAHDIKIYGKVFNSKTGEAIQARISFTQLNDNSETSLSTGKEGFSSQLKSMNQYSIKIESKGYISSMEKLDLQSFELNSLELNYKLQPAEIGTTVNLKSVLFEQSKTNLLPESFAELDLVVSFLRENPEVKIELAGHTDNRGVPFQNVKLSQGRVDKVKEYLISKGVDGRRISGTGYGGTRPIASNESEETRKLNRRVEFTIKKN